MPIYIVGIPNQTSQSYTDVTTIDPATLEPADMPASNLKNEEPSEIGRIKSLDPSRGQWIFDTSFLPVTLGGFAVENHNVTLGGQFRFLAGDVGGGLTPTKTPPQSIIASSNLTGVVGNVDEDVSSPDGLILQPTTQGSTWTVTFQFTGLSGTVDPGDDKLCFVIRARRLFVGAGATNPTTLPKLTASIPAAASSSGLEIPLGYRAVTNSNAGGQFFIFPFTKSDLLTVATPMVSLRFDPGLSASGSQYAVLDTVSLFYEKIDTPSYTNDSGWITVPGDPRPAPAQPVKRIHYFPETPWEGMLDYTVMVRSDQTQHDPPLTVNDWIPASAITEPVDFIQAGVVVAGESYEIEQSQPLPDSPGGVIGVTEVSAEAVVGKTYSADAFRNLQFKRPIEMIVTRDQLLVLQDQLAFRRGRSGAFYVALEPGVELRYQLFTSAWVVCTGMSEPTQYGAYQPDGTNQYKLSMTLEQKS